MEKVVYTVLTGGYDRLEQPLVTHPDFKYVCFTDRSGTDGVWELREIPFEGSPVLRARWAKMHPHIILKEFRFSIFMDANLCICGNEFYEAVLSSPIAVLEHPERDCVWEELRYCYLKDKVSTASAFKIHKMLKGMPRHWGLAETNVIAREHNDPTVIALDELWWQMLLEYGGTRDQLVFTPALHKLGMMPALFLGPGLNARNVPFIKYTNHPLSGRENTPGKLNWSNVRYNLRLMWRKAMLPCLK